MRQQRATVYRVPRLPQSETRALAYLVIDGDDDVDAAPVLNRLIAAKYSSIEKERKRVWARFEHWLGHATLNEYHHGWENDPEFSMGYVFKWDDRKHQHRRLYGFLMSPRPRFEVCVLCCYRAKAEHETEAEVKRIVRRTVGDAEVQEEVRRAFN